MGEREGERTAINSKSSLMKVPPEISFNFNNRLKARLPNIIILGVRASTCEFGGGHNLAHSRLVHIVTRVG